MCILLPVLYMGSMFFSQVAETTSQIQTSSRNGTLQLCFLSFKQNGCDSGVLQSIVGKCHNGSVICHFTSTFSHFPPLCLLRWEQPGDFLPSLVLALRIPPRAQRDDSRLKQIWGWLQAIKPLILFLGGDEFPFTSYVDENQRVHKVLTDPHMWSQTVDRDMLSCL